MGDQKRDVLDFKRPSSCSRKENVDKKSANKQEKERIAIGERRGVIVGFGFGFNQCAGNDKESCRGNEDDGEVNAT